MPKVVDVAVPNDVDINLFMMLPDNRSEEIDVGQKVSTDISLLTSGL